ncbi:TIGR01244 family sulfur transferase [Zobellella maritima]|uniref:TIGR01244 family sulfur transferase n=1 Tax=Zobellella maritima TaxID=2059725 RepID=UPI000E3073AB|nr:TIGR01244 family sulfur transferase [Zobellella maritima]
MEIRQVTADFSVADQITPADLAELKSRGFTTLICNRPDHEVVEQPTASQLAEAARSMDLDWYWIPISSGNFTEEAIVQFRQALARAGHTLAFCRTGTRSITLWSLSQALHTPPADLLRLGRQAGYDLQGSEARLQGIYQDHKEGKM